MSRNQLEIKNLYKNFDGVEAVVNFSCRLGKGEILGLIGPNGAGKSTIFDIITGFTYPDMGSVVFRGVELIGLPPNKIVQNGISRTFQNLRVIRHMSILDNVLMFFQNHPGEKLRNLFFRWKMSNYREAKNQKLAISLIKEAGLSEKLNTVSEDLSYGQQKLLTLICCLASDSDLLLLDEPVAGIAPGLMEKITLIISKLTATGKSVIIIEHNLDAVMRICDRVVFMDSGLKVSEGKPKEVRNDPKVIEAYLD